MLSHMWAQGNGRRDGAGIRCLFAAILAIRGNDPTQIKSQLFPRILPNPKTCITFSPDS